MDDKTLLFELKKENKKLRKDLQSYSKNAIEIDKLLDEILDNFDTLGKNIESFITKVRDMEYFY